MRDIWFTADTHFGHINILKFHPNRPGDTIEEHDEALAETWNTYVKPGDTVYHLGDFAMGKLDYSLRWFHKLNGQKHLLRGNHDGPRTLALPWTSVKDIGAFKQKPHKAVLCHFPMLTWDGAHKGAWMLHGHSHGLLDPATDNPTRMDVGVDTSEIHGPYHLDEITAIMDGAEYTVVDAHS